MAVVVVVVAVAVVVAVVLTHEAFHAQRFGLRVDQQAAVAFHERGREVRLRLRQLLDPRHEEVQHAGEA